jgi:hypothetical protein
MLRLGKHIRLTKKDIERLTFITGFTLVNVKTLDDLDDYLAQCKRFYWGVSEDTRFLHWLMDKERSNLLAATL